MKRLYSILFIVWIICTNTYAQADSSRHAVQTVLLKKADFLHPVPANQSTKNFGVFCRQELLMEKRLSIPVKLRLGSIDYCNYLEQKTAYKLPKQ
jgi:hypothetical protein